MITMKNILVATDFSETSDVAFAYARSLARSFGATLHVIHVVENTGYLWGTEAYAVAMPDMLTDIVKDVERRLTNLLDEEERKSLDANMVVVIGVPFLEIIRYASDHNVDLIVLGTHGRGPILHMLLGSVAERVVRKAPCPVLTVRHPGHEFVLPVEKATAATVKK